MITEDYVSFEIAKLLKEKGFDVPTMYFFSADGNEIKFQQAHYIDDVARPTQSIALKWLREIHSLHIQVFYDMEKSAFGTSIIPTMYPISDKIEQNALSFDYKGITYEEACEAAIKYCLENLI